MNTIPDSVLVSMLLPWKPNFPVLGNESLKIINRNTSEVLFKNDLKQCILWKININVEKLVNETKQSDVLLQLCEKYH